VIISTKKNTQKTVVMTKTRWSICTTTSSSPDGIQSTRQRQISQKWQWQRMSYGWRTMTTESGKNSAITTSRMNFSGHIGYASI